PGMKIQTVLSTTEKSIFDTNAGLRRDRQSAPTAPPAVTALTSHNTPGSPAGDTTAADTPGHSPRPAGVNGTLTQEGV
ncbi:hypothetical protein, partial [Pseudonocardia sp. Ae331_Ps2]